MVTVRPAEVENTFRRVVGGGMFSPQLAMVQPFTIMRRPCTAAGGIAGVGCMYASDDSVP